MQGIKTAVLASALTMGTLASAAHAAPDGTLGMAIMSAVVDLNGVLQQGRADPAVPVIRQHKDVFQIQRGISEKR